MEFPESSVGKHNKMGSNGEPVDIKIPTGVKSPIWAHFGHPVYEENGVRQTDKTHVICRFCNTLLKHSGNTTNMKVHIARHHPTATVARIAVSDNAASTSKNEGVSLDQPKISSVFNNQSKYRIDSPKAQLITKKVATFIVSDMRPLYMVENTHFKDLLSSLDPRYSLPSRKYFTEKVIPDLYSEVSKKVQNELQVAQSVSITTDSWTSRATQGYLTVTVHFLNKHWEICNYVLTTRMVPVSHTGENIGSILKDVITEWKIDCHEIAVVTDNASNMDIAARKAELHQHIKCFAHTINLACQKGLKVSAMGRLLGRIRRIVTFFHKSTTATNVLASKQMLLGLPRHKLIMDVSTRWNSSMEMIERFLEQQAAILCALTSSEVKRNATEIVTLSDEDVNESEKAVEILRPLKVATAIMCEERYPTVSLIYPLKTQILESMMTKEFETESCLVKDIKKAIRDDLNKRYGSCEDEFFLLQASAIDPRFRSLPQLSDEKRDQVFDRLYVKVINQYSSEPELNHSGSIDQMEETESLHEFRSQDIDEGPSPPKKNDKTAMENFFAEVYSQSESASTVGCLMPDRLREEIRDYRSLPNIPITDNPLHCWKIHSDKYPYLSSIAKSLLSIPVTSVPSERVFSTAGDIVTATRSCLDPELVDKLIFIKKNLNV